MQCLIVDMDWQVHHHNSAFSQCIAARKLFILPTGLMPHVRFGLGISGQHQGLRGEPAGRALTSPAGAGYPLAKSRGKH